jgi:hypothetical protein
LPETAADAALQVTRASSFSGRDTLQSLSPTLSHTRELRGGSPGRALRSLPHARPPSLLPTPLQALGASSGTGASSTAGSVTAADADAAYLQAMRNEVASPGSRVDRRRSELSARRRQLSSSGRVGEPDTEDGSAVSGSSTPSASVDVSVIDTADKQSPLMHVPSFVASVSDRDSTSRRRNLVMRARSTRFRGGAGGAGGSGGAGGVGGFLGSSGNVLALTSDLGNTRASPSLSDGRQTPDTPAGGESPAVEPSGPSSQARVLHRCARTPLTSCVAVALSSSSQVRFSVTMTTATSTATSSLSAGGTCSRPSVRLSPRL